MREALCLVWLLLGGLFAQRCGDTPLLRMSTATSANGNTNGNANGNRTDFGVATEDGQHLYFRKPTAVYLHCTANRPIHFKVATVVASPVDEVYFSRDVVDLFNSDTYCYNATFRAGPSFEVTGKYTCSIIQDTTVSTSVFLFINSENGTVLLNDGLQTLVPGVPDDSGWITVPCVATSPAATPIISAANLLRHSFAAKALELKDDAVAYVPGIGFRLKALAPSPHCCSQQYICELKKNGDDIQQDSSTTIILDKTQAVSGKVFSRVDPSDYVLGHNARTETKRRVLQSSHVTLSCESNVPVKLEVKDKHRFEDFKQISTNHNSFYEHKVTLSGTAREVRQMEVSCETEATRQLLHKWSLTTVSPREFYPTAGIHFVNEKRYRPITCYSSTEKGPSIAIIRCDDVINCAIAQSFAHDILKPVEGDQRKFPYQIISGPPFCVKDRADPSTLGCAELSPLPWSRRGIVTCYEEQSGQKIVYAPKSFMTGVNDTIVELPAHAWEEAGRGTNDTSVLELSTGSDVLYVDEVLTVGCNASYGVFSMGIQLMFQLKNHTNLTILDFGSLGFVEHLEKDVITYKGQVKIEDEQIQRIWCFAPIWNSANWRRVYRDITVQVGHRSVITNESVVDHVHLSIGEEGRFLTCEVSGGEPDPVIRWTKDGEEVTKANHKVKLIEQNATTTGTITVLWFSGIVGAHAGNYSCEAFNVKGLAVKQFKVEVAGGQYSDWIYWAGGGGAILVISAIIICILLKLLRNRRDIIEKLSDLEIHEFQYGNQSLATKFAELNENARYLPYKEDFEIPKGKLEFREDEVLGAGAFGLVVKGYFTKHSEQIPVAIKTVRSNADIGQLRNLLSEIKILMYIGQHPNIIGLLGALTRDLRDGKLHVVVEYCAHGNLLSFLRESRQTFVNQISSGGKFDFRKTSTPSTKLRPASNFSTKSWKLDDFLPESQERRSSSSSVKSQDLITWAMQIADGMMYLGSKNVIHGDLATRNLLLTKSFVVKITDFGLSTHLYDYTNYIKKQRDEPVPWRWLSIEAIRDSKFSIATDVWAYGVTLWEIFTLAEVPYQGFSWGKEFVDKLFAGLRLSLPQYATEDIFRQMEKCWEQDPRDRTSFKDCRDFFSSLLNSTTSK